MLLHRISKNVWVEKWPWMVSNSQETQIVFKCHCFSWKSNKCVKPHNRAWAIRTEDLLFMISSLTFRKTSVCLQEEVLCLQLRATQHTVWLYVHVCGRVVLSGLREYHSHPVLKDNCDHHSATKEMFAGSCSRAGREKKTALSNLDWELIHWKISRVFQKNMLLQKAGRKTLLGT